MVAKKQGSYSTTVASYGNLRLMVEYKPLVNELLGGLGVEACWQLSAAVSIDYQGAGGEHTWSANNFASK